MAEQGAFSPDGKRIAYNPVFQWEPDWRGYQGGQTTRIWIARLADSSVTKIPRGNSNDSDPMWLGGHVYFLSDRNGAATLFDYDTASGKLAQLVTNDGFPIDAASAGAGAIVYTQMGELHLLDLASGNNSIVPVTIDGPLPQTVPYFKKAAKEIEHCGHLADRRPRRVRGARRDSHRAGRERRHPQLTHTADVAERDPAWSPDGKSDRVFLRRIGRIRAPHPRPGWAGPPRKIDLGQPPSFFYSHAGRRTARRLPTATSA